MFGLIYGLIGIIGRVGLSIKNISDERYCKKHFNDPDTNTYLDAYGTRRDIDTNGIRNVIKDKNGDVVLSDPFNNIIRNYSKEKRDAKYSNPKYTAIRMTDWNVDSIGCRGVRFKDKKTGELYVVRGFYVENFKHVKFFMSVDTAHLIRMSDGEMARPKTQQEILIINKFIKDFNNKQDSHWYAIDSQKYHDVGFSCYEYVSYDDWKIED